MYLVCVQWWTAEDEQCTLPQRETAHPLPRPPMEEIVEKLLGVGMRGLRVMTYQIRHPLEPQVGPCPLRSHWEQQMVRKKSAGQWSGQGSDGELANHTEGGEDGVQPEEWPPSTKAVQSAGEAQILTL